MRTNWIVRTGLVAALVGAAPLLAQPPYTFPSPTPQYTSMTTLMPVTAANGSSSTTHTGGGQTLTFSSSMTAFNVPGSWPVWGAPPHTEGTPPRVLATPLGVTTLTITLANPSNTFGFEIEPASVGSHNVTAQFFNGATLIMGITQSIAYDSARLMVVSHSAPVTSVQISAPGSGGFAVAQFRFGNAIVGAPATAIPALGLPELGALGLMLAAAGALLARRQQTA